MSLNLEFPESIAGCATSLARRGDLAQKGLSCLEVAAQHSSNSKIHLLMLLQDANKRGARNQCNFTLFQRRYIDLRHDSTHDATQPVNLPSPGYRHEDGDRKSTRLNSS